MKSDQAEAILKIGRGFSAVTDCTAKYSVNKNKVN